MQVWSSSRSLRHISKWSSPALAKLCSPDSSMMDWIKGSDLVRHFNPSTNLGRSAGFMASTATLTTGPTLNITRRAELCPFDWHIIWANKCILESSTERLQWRWGHLSYGQMTVVSDSQWASEQMCLLKSVCAQITVNNASECVIMRALRVYKETIIIG